MVKRFERVGDGFAIIIDRPTLERLGIDPEIPFELTTERGGLFLNPVATAEDHKARVERSAARMAAIHHDSLKKLAQ
jgi:hypothetical protein